MKLITHRLILIAAAVVAACLPTAAFCQPYSPAVNAPALQPGVIEGSLMKPSGGIKAPSVEGLTVTIAETGQTATTDPYGYYTFTNVKPGTYSLLATGEGYSRLRIIDVVVSPNRIFHIGPVEMAMVLNGTQQMEPVEVNATKQAIVELEKFVVTEEPQSQVKPPPFSGNDFDLSRGIDDVQPYYVWDSMQIELSGASNVQDFFQREVPMDTNKASYSQTATFGDLSNISIGGLSSNNNGTASTQSTLILVDGLPQAAFVELGSSYQPSLNGIPVAAIDRIEVLTSAASAIYGANATGGVINVILKHDYTGGELDYTYNNSFGTDSPVRSTSLTFGESLEGGKTSIMLTANYQDSKPLLVQDRSQITEPYEARYLSLYPGGEAAYLGITTTTGAIPTTAASVMLNTPFVRSANNTPLIKGTTATQLEIPAGYQSFQANGLGPLQANIGNYNLSHINSNVSNGTYGEQYPLEEAPQIKGVNLMLRRQMTPWLEAFFSWRDSSMFSPNPGNQMSLSGVTVPASAPGNPFGQAVTVSAGNAVQWQDQFINDIVTQAISTGLKASLPHDWKSELDYTWSSGRFDDWSHTLNTAAVQGAVTSGALNVITDLSLNPISQNAFASNLLFNNVSSLNALQFRLAGPLMHLWAGTPTVAVGAGHQLDGFDFSEEYISQPSNVTYGASNSIAGEFVWFTGQFETHNSAYAELQMPLVSKDNKIFGVRELDLEAVGRDDAFDEYTTSPGDHIAENLANGTTATAPNLANGQIEPFTQNPTSKYHSANGTIGFKYKPVNDLTLRWSFSTGFDTPTYTQLESPVSTGTVTEPTTPASEINAAVPTTSPWSYSAVADPVTNTTYFVPVETGGNPALTPETSRAIDWGVIFEPKFLHGLRISLDYTKVTKYNDIITPTTATLIQNAAAFPNRVQRSSPTGPIVFINDTYINAPETFTSSYNLEADYVWTSATLGTWKLSGVANSWQHYDLQSTIGGATVEQLANPYGNTSSGFGTGAGLAKFKANVGLDWSKGPYFAGWSAQYVGPYCFGSYYGLNAQGVAGPFVYDLGTVNGWVSSQIYHDVYVGYRIGKAAPKDAWWKRALANSSVRFEVFNVFDAIPPYDGVSLGFPALYSPYGDLRLATYSFTVKKQF